MEVELEEVLLAEPEVMLVVEAIASTMEEEENEEDEEGGEKQMGVAEVFEQRVSKGMKVVHDPNGLIS